MGFVDIVCYGALVIESGVFGAVLEFVSKGAVEDYLGAVFGNWDDGGSLCGDSGDYGGMV